MITVSAAITIETQAPVPEQIVPAGQHLVGPGGRVGGAVGKRAAHALADRGQERGRDRKSLRARREVRRERVVGVLPPMFPERRARSVELGQRRQVRDEIAAIPHGRTHRRPHALTGGARGRAGAPRQLGPIHARKPCEELPHASVQSRWVET